MTMRLLTPKEVAYRLGWNPSTIYVKKCRGTLTIPYLQLGRSLRFRPEDVDAWLASQTVSHGSCDRSAHRR